VNISGNSVGTQAFETNKDLKEEKVEPKVGKDFRVNSNYPRG
jgi:hypothetical protein